MATTTAMKKRARNAAPIDIPTTNPVESPVSDPLDGGGLLVG